MVKKVLEDGFLFIGSSGTFRVFVVQAWADRGMFIQKHVQRGKYWYRVPEEIRISTCPQALVQLPRPYTVDGVPRIHFNELVAWQKYKDGRYTLYYK